MSALALSYVLPLRATAPVAELRAYLARLVEEVDDVIVVDASPPAVRAVHEAWWTGRLTHLAPEEPETLFTPGGSSLGWAPNAAIGFKKARPERPVVALVGDGGFVFSNPLAALWTAQRAGTACRS